MMLSSNVVRVLSIGVVSAATLGGCLDFTPITVTSWSDAGTEDVAATIVTDVDASACETCARPKLAAPRSRLQQPRRNAWSCSNAASNKAATRPRQTSWAVWTILRAASGPHEPKRSGRRAFPGAVRMRDEQMRGIVWKLGTQHQWSVPQH